jgi:DNA-binding NtrC family response regulator
MMTVMVVEKNANSFYKTIDLLDNMGATAIRAKKITDIAGILSKYPVDIVLIDANSPENEDAIAVTLKIKSISPKLPVIVKSENFMPYVVCRSFYAGCDDYIFKPFSVDDFYVTMEKYSYLVSVK